jgi:hypothetical protein
MQRHIPCTGPRRNYLHRHRHHRLMRHTDSGEYLQAPVVVTTDTHWSGFRPDRLRSLTAA